MHKLSARIKAAAAALVFASAVTAPLNINAAEDESAAEPIQLFFLNDIYSEYLTMDENIPQSYQLPNDEKYTIRNSIISVDENGVVTPKGREIYYIGEGKRFEYTEGTASITGAESGKVYTFGVSDYARYYACSVADKYLEDNIIDAMTDEEKLDAICRFVASYDYSPYHSAMIPMIVTGEGGDCWASVETVNYMCEKLGFTSRSRNAANDPGAGSGHRNNVVLTDDGTLYMLETGYSGKAPRAYDVSKCSSAFLTTKLSDGTLSIREYIGFSTDVEIPAEINGIKVTALGSSALSNANRYLDSPITSVTIPNTVTTIGSACFWDMDELKELFIPASVTSIEMAAFSDCDNLTLTIDSKNESYMMLGNVIYTKDMKTLVEPIAFNEKDYSSSTSYSYVHKTFTVPERVEYIGDQAFNNCGSLTGAELPEGLRHIGYRSFYGCSFDQPLVLPASVEGLGYASFTSSGVPAYVFKNADCVINDTLENNLNEQESGETLDSYRGGSLPVIIIAPKGSTAEKYAEKYRTRTVNIISTDGTSATEERVRYVFAEYVPNGKTVIDSGEGWELSYTEKDGITLGITAEGAVSELEGFVYGGAVGTVNVDKSVESIDKSITNSLRSVKKVCGEKDTYAETLAESLGCEFAETNSGETIPPVPQPTPIGDCNGDNAVNAADLVTLHKYILGVGELKSPERADICQDFDINVFDLVLLKAMLVDSL